MQTIAIWVDNKALGIRCAKVLYGTDFINDVLQGHHYHDRNGALVVRLTRGERDDDDQCEHCKEALFICNAYEVQA